jgi:hypothetical protein
MKEKGLVKHVAYSPNEYLKIEGVKSKFVNWRIPLIISMFIVSTIIALVFHDMLIFMFLSFISTLIFNNTLNFASHYVEFSTQKVIVRESQKQEELEHSVYLKSPIYLDITIKPRKELLVVTFEQFGEKIGTAALPPDELPYMLDGLSDLLELEIHETRSTNKNEDILYLRPIGSDENLLPSYLKITENQLRLIVNPVESLQNFIVNYQRKILKTATGDVYATDEIHTINFMFDAKKIIIKSLVSNHYQPFTIIEFTMKGYHPETIKKDLQLLANFLKSKLILNHITF